MLVIRAEVSAPEVMVNEIGSNKKLGHDDTKTDSKADKKQTLN
jgi:hypothetical protein